MSSESLQTFGCVWLTCADSDGFYELVSPAVGSYQQSQVGLLYELVHCVLAKERTDDQCVNSVIKVATDFIFFFFPFCFSRQFSYWCQQPDCFTAISKYHVKELQHK